MAYSEAIEGLTQVILHLDVMTQISSGDDELRYRELRDYAEDALELLKEQEPRVIDISEIYTAKKLDVWLEDKSDIVHPIMLIETEMTNKSQTAFFYPMLVRPIKAYGKTWRCWTARPTDEQRKAVKWDG